MNRLVIAAIAAVSMSAVVALPAAAQRDTQAQPSQARTLAQLDMNAVPELDRGSIRRVQRILQDKGFDPGLLSGIVTPKTREAVRKYQDRYGIKASGDIDNQTLFALGLVDGKSASDDKDNEPPPRRASPPPRDSKPTRESTPPREKTRRTEKEPPPRTPRATPTTERGGYHWCAAYSNGSTNCGFSTIEQCRAAVSGVGGSCQAQ